MPDDARHFFWSVPQTEAKNSFVLRTVKNIQKQTTNNNFVRFENHFSLKTIHKTTLNSRKVIFKILIKVSFNSSNRYMFFNKPSPFMFHVGIEN